MKVLWLASWYPNKVNPTNGDFVQRHAKAVSLFCNVHVIHVEKDTENLLEDEVEMYETNEKNLRETIVLYKTKKSPFEKIVSFLTYKKLFKQQVKRYLHRNGLPDVVHVQNAMKAGVIALWMKERFGIPYVITDQWTIYDSKVADRYEKRNIFFKKLTKKIFANASLFISVSKNLTEIIAKKIVVVPYKIAYNVVDTKRFFYKPEDKYQTFTFVHASTFKEQKNPQAIIDAFISFNKEFPNTRLLMIGEIKNDIKTYYSNKKTAENIIEFTGFIPNEKLGATVQKCHAFVLFSRRENMPCVVLEALCCGLPVITSNAGGVAEVIEKENGIVVYNYEVDELVKAMKSVYQNYNQYNRKAIAEKAAVMFSYEAIGKRISEIYETVKRRK